VTTTREGAGSRTLDSGRRRSRRTRSPPLASRSCYSLLGCHLRVPHKRSTGSMVWRHELSERFHPRQVRSSDTVKRMLLPSYCHWAWSLMT
jgi:hypothetical protein